MGGLSFWHVAIFVLVVIVFVAHRRIPAVMETAGRALGRLRHDRGRPAKDNVIEGKFERLDD